MSNENIENMIAAVAGGQTAEANDYFRAALNDKIASSMEARRVEVAQSMVQGTRDEDV